MKASTEASMIKLLRALSSEKKLKLKRTRRSLLEKQRAVDEIKKLLKKYRCVAIISLEGVPSYQYNLIKRELESYGLIRVFKNSVFLRAAKESGIPRADGLSSYMTGTNAFLFTNINPYEIALEIEKAVAPKYAKPGDKAESDIYIPEGPTGIPPGPMLSVFGKLKIRTQVREGIIWVAKETKVAKAGDIISPELASLLRRLDIKPLMTKLALKAVWEEGKLYPSDMLKVDIEAFRDEILRAIHVSKEVAVETAMPLPEIIPEAFVRAYRRAILLAAETGYITSETALAVLNILFAKAKALAAVIAGKAPELGINIAPAAAPSQPSPATSPSEEKKEEKEEEKEKEVSEEEIAEGISSLFG